MRAIMVEAFGKPDGMVIRDLPDPVPAPGEVLIDVHAIGLNYPDLLVIAGTYQILPPLPFSPGKEVAGVVVSVGRGVEEFKPGDRVMAQLENGGYAERVTAPSANCFHVPAELSMAKAAAMGLVYQTSYFGLVDRGQFKPGDWVLVTGAAGGVGIAAVQLAKAMGGKVLAGIGSQGKADFVLAHGADAVIDMSGGDLRDSVRKQVQAATGGHGADVLIDPVGGAVFEASLRALAWSGRAVVVGFTSGEIPSVKINYLLIKHISVAGLHWSDYRERTPEKMQQAQDHMFQLVRDGKLDPPVMPGFRFAEYNRALSVIAERQVLGKVVLLTDAGARSA